MDEKKVKEKLLFMTEEIFKIFRLFASENKKLVKRIEELERKVESLEKKKED